MKVDLNGRTAFVSATLSFGALIECGHEPIDAFLQSRRRGMK